ncbi:HNH endonuclease [Duganella sp. FT92W]|uniref:HNH endonuclease n=1 Tax=Pseudoduganella rivuli TaxID=2666085 RepID=A0A7X2IMG3_9BURK|nr:HNH endonuclease [Pseudoduganella rivuli]
MPKRPKCLCRQRGCGELLDQPGYCSKHSLDRSKADREQRGSAAERGYDNAWAKARAAYLAKHPLCVTCCKEGRSVAATVVDHIRPHRLKQAIDSGNAATIELARRLFWDSANNWQSMCKPHHDQKTATQDGGFGHRRTAG